MERNFGSWYTYSDSGVWHCFDMRMSELMQDQVPEDYEEDVGNSQLNGQIRCCHAMLDRHDNPDVTFPTVCSLFYATLFEQSPQFHQWEHEVPEDIKIRRVYEIHDYIMSMYGDERNKNINKFLIVVRFGVFTINDHYHDEDDEIDEIEIGFVPASKSSIEALEKVSDLGDGQECAICLEEGKKEAKKMPCEHVFHGRCIEQWLEKSHLCPLCRYAMPVHD